MPIKNQVPLTPDEMFKVLVYNYFKDFSHVITEYEITKLPKKVDIFIIETDKPIKDHVTFFNYFKKFNIIEFKSYTDPFRIRRDLPKLQIYTAGFLLKTNEAHAKNTTFTLVTARRPEKLLKMFKSSLIIVKNGLYYIGKDMLGISIYVVVIKEMNFDLNKEVMILKEFTATFDRKDVITQLLNCFINDPENEQIKELVEYAYALYPDMVQEVIQEKELSVTIVEKNIIWWNEQIGLDKRYEQKGFEKGRYEEKIETTKNMLMKGLSVDLISECTGLSHHDISKLMQ